jgi:hypothetical protein
MEDALKIHMLIVSTQEVHSDVDLVLLDTKEMESPAVSRGSVPSIMEVVILLQLVLEIP